MRKLVITILLVSLSLTGFSQSFEKFEDMKDVTAMVMNQKMFKLLGKMDLDSKDPEMKNYINMVNSLKEIQVYATKNSSAASMMKSEFNAYKGSQKLEQLMRVKDDGKNVNFYYKPGKSEDFVSEFLMFLNGEGDEDTVIIKITGDIDLKEIGKIASSINFEGSEELKNVKVD
ncbi:MULTISPECIES: DUF4252 domain-containing protein [unclassified Leeuwenhoekiella]|uniref:DUF4252 domain-containing protein n=1 Tax=unclassified Leeuwenhoekiella TaxID=2615029 RepID=UPI000C45DAB7|nr:MULTISPECIES: DUF4252 domain-containing protein [unclassified Leeuwenhoekiella]MAW94740.1 DNA topoisomerase IV [Leeuwenhoekiella sp.]MAW95515.1 DNA topoisomerase IV [Leeuwenhoekiella sp.]MBA82163.1 DNA topoisomerase IV [Leeuwenhoekiella sp.]|tara:strand:- start:7428 stop:7946 length:519 start_codon:yes stop_codon:yes gene_type:complete